MSEKATTVREVMTAALWMYEKGGLKWHQGSFFKDLNEAQLLFVARENPNAVCSACAEGCLELVQVELGVLDETYTLLNKEVGRGLAGWNDVPGRTKDDVIKLFRKVLNRLPK